MPKIIMVIETIPVADGGPDPLDIDPQTIAEQIVAEHYEGCIAEGEPEETVKLVSAEWVGEWVEQ